MSAKVFVLAPDEDWIVDRFVHEWYADNADMSVTKPRQADVVWLLADWAWDKIPPQFLISRKVLTTVHHIVPEKFNLTQRNNFVLRDTLTTAYHVPNHFTKEAIQGLTKKPIHVIPYWANQKIWKITGNKPDFRQKHNLPKDAFIIGSFQRDTEGSDLISPKLEKGPDLFADFVEKIIVDSNEWTKICERHASGIHVLLAGWRRQYLISRLESAGIPYTYIQHPKQEILNELYQCLDLYPITARYEGGPQSLLECGLLNVPVISRNVGLASQVLPVESINDNVFFAKPTIPFVDGLRLPLGYEPYRKVIQTL